MRLVVLLLLPLLLATLVPSAAAQSGPGDGPRWVEASFDLAQPSLFVVSVSGELRIHKYPLDGQSFSAQGLSDAYALSPDATVANIETAVRNSLAVTLAESFGQAQREIVSVTVDQASLTGARSNEYEPPVRVAILATVTRNADQLGLGSLSSDAIASVYRAGAVITSEIKLRAEAGDEATFTIHAPAVPSGIEISAGIRGAERAASAKSAQILLDNLAGNTRMTRTIDVETRDSAAKPPTSEVVATDVEISLGEIVRGASSLATYANVAIHVQSIDLEARAPGALPGNVKLAFASAEAVRDLSRTGALASAAIKNVEEALTAETDQAMGAALGTDVETTGKIAGTSQGTGPIEFTALSMGSYQFGSPNAAYALEIGAALRFNIAIPTPKHDARYVIFPPTNLEIARAEGASVAPEHRFATVSLAAGEAPRVVALFVRAADVVTPTAEDAAIRVTIDLKELSTTLGGASSGDFGSLTVGVTASGSIEAIRVPDDLKAYLGENVELEFLTAKSIRFAKESGIVTNEQIVRIEVGLMETLSKGLSSALGETARVTGGFAAGSLSPGAVGPVEFSASTEFVMRLGGAAPQTAAVSLYSLPQSFTFPRVRELDTSYTVILPRGLAVRDLVVDGGVGSLGESSDGREQFTVTPNESKAHTTMSIAVTPTFVLAKFWPVVLLAVILLVLIVGTPIAIFTLRRKRAK